MATYKMIQDIEAEDKILGPLTLRQFIFALISIFLFYISFILLTKGVALLLIIFLPPALFFGFFALPLGRDQPTEVWALAKLRFFLKPRRRVWDQSGMKELVTITVPKKIERALTDGLSPYEIRSRLSTLATTIDSRGWAVKNATVNEVEQGPTQNLLSSSDRLVSASSLPQEVPAYEVQASDDIMDTASNPIAQQFDQMIQQSAQDHRQQLVQQINASSAQQQSSTDTSKWFMPQPADTTPQIPTATDVPAQEATAGEEALIAKLRTQHQDQKSPYGNLRTIQPLGTATAAPINDAVVTADPPMTAPTDPAILSLANNNDFSVATIAREAQKAKGEETGTDEVVISLH